MIAISLAVGIQFFVSIPAEGFQVARWLHREAKAGLQDRSMIIANFNCHAVIRPASGPCARHLRERSSRFFACSLVMG